MVAPQITISVVITPSAKIMQSLIPMHRENEKGIQISKEIADLVCQEIMDNTYGNGIKKSNFGNPDGKRKQSGGIITNEISLGHPQPCVLGTDVMTSEMVVEKLLEPRVKVEHLYPGCKFKKGEILSRHLYTEDCFISEISECGIYIFRVEIDDSIRGGANIFRYLQWFEDRWFVEMPKYIKNDKGDVFKIINIENLQQFGEISVLHNVHGYPLHVLAKRYHPATESEYIAYESSKNE